MEWFNTNIFFLISAIILLVVYMLYLVQRKDSTLTNTPPHIKQLPRSKYEQAFRELEEFKIGANPKSRNDQVKRNSEQYYLECRLNEILKQTEEEQRSYILACKECEIAWKDYTDFFNSVPLIQRIVSISKNKELTILRNLYLQTKGKVDIELEKFNARTRVRLHEEKIAQERDRNIEERTIQQEQKLEEEDPPGNHEITTDNNKQNFRLPKKDSPEPPSANHTIEEAFNEIQLRNDSVNSSSQSEKIISKPSKIAPLPKPTKVIQKSVNNFNQNNFNDKYPDFYQSTYIDDHLSLKELGLAVVHDANFDSSFLVSVLFKDKHEYQNCSFKGTDLSFSIWQRSENPHRIINCDFSSSKFNSARVEFTAFYNCKFNKTDFTGTQFKTVKFVNCEFKECLIKNVDFSDTVMSADMLDEIDFSVCFAQPKNAINTGNSPQNLSKNDSMEGDLKTRTPE